MKKVSSKLNRIPLDVNFTKCNYNTNWVQFNKESESNLKKTSAVDSGCDFYACIRFLVRCTKVTVIACLMHTQLKLMHVESILCTAPSTILSNWSRT